MRQNSTEITNNETIVDIDLFTQQLWKLINHPLLNYYFRVHVWLFITVLYLTKGALDRLLKNQAAMPIWQLCIVSIDER